MYITQNSEYDELLDMKHIYMTASTTGTHHWVRFLILSCTSQGTSVFIAGARRFVYGETKNTYHEGTIIYCL